MVDYLFIILSIYLSCIKARQHALVIKLVTYYYILLLHANLKFYYKYDNLVKVGHEVVAVSRLNILSLRVYIKVQMSINVTIISVQ